jgi:hypothetical protein
MRNMLNTIYEQQMLQLLNFVSNEALRYQELILINKETSEVVNYFGLRKVFKVISQIKDQLSLDRALIMSISYVADLH